MPLIEELNDKPIPEDQIWKELDEAYHDDTQFENCRVLYSMCNSPPEIARQAHLKFIESNLGDASLYPGTLSLENSVINMIGSLLNAPETVGGRVLNGGSEANIMSLWIAREKKNSNANLEVVVPASAHYSIDVACHMLKLKVRRVKLDNNWKMDVKAAAEAVNDKTCAVVGIAGTTELGVIDPIPELHKMCTEKEIFFHVDAAFGGFVFPFLALVGYKENIPLFDFRLNSVRTITIDPHKMGRSTQPAGVLMARERDDLETVKFDSYYLSAGVQHTMLGTRCSASVAATYAVMRKMGKNGYIDMLQQCMDKTNHLCRLLKNNGFELAIDKPIAPIVVVRLEKAAERVKKRLLEDFNWRVSETLHPRGIRIVLMPHLKQDLSIFVNDLLLACKKEKIL
jgi:tyrosine decarboxylase/aspartate 1-decarboxylase